MNDIPQKQLWEKPTLRHLLVISCFLALSTRASEIVLLLVVLRKSFDKRRKKGDRCYQAIPCFNNKSFPQPKAFFKL